jgi:hypothetical protein
MAEESPQTPPGSPVRPPRSARRLSPDEPASPDAPASPAAPASPDDPASHQTPDSPPPRPTTPLDRGVLEDGSLDIDFGILDEDGKTVLPIQGIIALALNEAGRKLGYGMSYYCPSRYPDSPSVPELFYNACTWTDGDRQTWDMAPHYIRLQMVTQINADDIVLPMRAVVQDEPEGM